MKELIIQAKIENLSRVLAFVDEELEALGCSMKTQMQVDVAVEEAFVNIASYAYVDKDAAREAGNVNICLEEMTNPAGIKITFTDSGIPFNPLEKPDPDITLSAQERKIGGLGIFMVKKSMDDVQYAYRDGCNILVLQKAF